MTDEPNETQGKEWQGPHAPEGLISEWSEPEGGSQRDKERMREYQLQPPGLDVNWFAPFDFRLTNKQGRWRRRGVNRWRAD